VITRGGEAANIVPAHCSAEFSVRGVTVAHREEVLARVMACAEAAALATGCRLESRLSKPYDDILPNPTLARLFEENIAPLGRQVIPPDPNEGVGSTDMGNVSQVTPAIHPYLATVGPDVGGHTPEFREECVSEAGRRAMLDAAKGMALTAVDLLSEPELVARAKAELAGRPGSTSDGDASLANQGRRA
jgi:metal-dependent amidase/aminoacylase/carboxypeptidase family protein